jgi:hypothetical protein
MDDFRKAQVKEPDQRDFGCGCCGMKLNGSQRRPHRRRARARSNAELRNQLGNELCNELCNGEGNNGG